MSIKSFININNKYDRVIVLVDMDCFYCQVEEKLNPLLKGKPIAVVQYNAWKGGGIIAVNYPARNKGVTRHMRGDEAKEHCPEIELVKVPSVRDKADLTKYRDAGKDVATVLQTFTNSMERASVDEAYLDITESVLLRIQEMHEGKLILQPEKLLNCYAVGYENIGNFVQNISVQMNSNNNASNSQENSYDNECDRYEDDEDNVITEEMKILYKKSDIKLLIGASIVNEIRAAVKEKTGYECSAGIAHNKILAKLVCGMNKPNKQTLIPLRYVKQLLSTLPIRKIKGLGAKFGEDVCENLKIQFVGELQKFSKQELQKCFDEKNGLFLHLIGQGIDLEAIIPRFLSKSIGCCKKFPGRTAIFGIATLNHWLTELSKEILERIAKDEIENDRKPKQMVINFMQTINNEDVSLSRCTPPQYIIPNDVEQMAKDSFDIIKKNTEKFVKDENLNVLNNPIKFLGISVGKFESINSGNNCKNNTIQNMFNHQINKQNIKQTEKCSSENSSDEKVQISEIINENVEIKLTDSNDKKIEKKEINSFFTKFKEIKTVNKIENATEISETKVEIPLVVDATVKKTKIENEKCSTSTDFKHGYAEFHPQSIEEFYELCTECNKKILIMEMQSHTDKHYAFKLSQDQRLEFRNQLKNKVKPTPPSKKRFKIDIDNSQKQTTHLNNFFKKIDYITSTAVTSTVTTPSTPETATTSSTTTLDDTILKENCKECNKLIPIDKLIEHMDLHLAQKFHYELNPHLLHSTQSTITTVKQSATTKLLTKKRMGNTNSNHKNKSIDYFFKSQQ